MQEKVWHFNLLTYVAMAFHGQRGRFPRRWQVIAKPFVFPLRCECDT